MVIYGIFKKKISNFQSAKILLFHTSPLNTDYQINNKKYIPNIGNISFPHSIPHFFPHSCVREKVRCIKL